MLSRQVSREPTNIIWKTPVHYGHRSRQTSFHHSRLPPSPSHGCHLNESFSSWLDENTFDISMVMSIHHRAATASDLTQILDFLKNNDLPTAGVSEALENFVIAEDQNGTWVGIAGFEHYGESCLLRSVAIDERFRGQGHGRTLVDNALRKAKAKGARKGYLVTDDAEDYFKRLGFKVVSRADIEETVKSSPEFAVCRQSALAMWKDI